MHLVGKRDAIGIGLHGQAGEQKAASGLEPANFRTEVDGKQTDLFVLKE